MYYMIDIIGERDAMFGLLQSLDANAIPLFGKMTPQHMVEHLTMIVSASNGKMAVGLFLPKETADVLKALMIYSPKELVPGIKSPLLGDDPPPLVHENFATAIEALQAELEIFDEYFRLNPNATPMQPRMGELNYKEWVILHNKHFKHHFKQFGLI